MNIVTENNQALKSIFHLDLDAFFCAVEVLIKPELEGKPFVVGGKSNRGVVTSASYAARRFGVRSAMPMARATQLCPGLIVVSSTRNEYGKRSKQVMEILNGFSDHVEQLSIDEAYIEVNKNSSDSILKKAKDLQSEILNKTGLPCSIGVASNKLVAKIANDFGKASTKTNSYPMSIKIVEEGAEREFLHPLPVDMLMGVGPKTAARLEELGIYTIGDISDWPLTDLVNRFGQSGYSISLKSQGIDNRKINTKRRSKSVSQESTFFEDISDEKKILSIIKKQSDKIGKSLKSSEKKGATIKIKLRWTDFSTITRQKTIEFPTNDPKIIYSNAKSLLAENWNKKRPIRLIGVGISNFDQPTKQLSLWDSPNNLRQAKIQKAITDINRKLGKEKIFKGSKNR